MRAVVCCQALPKRQPLTLCSPKGRQLPHRPKHARQDLLPLFNVLGATVGVGVKSELAAVVWCLASLGAVGPAEFGAASVRELTPAPPPGLPCHRAGQGGSSNGTATCGSWTAGTGGDGRER